MFALITEASDDVAVWTSESVAREPEVSPAPVSVRVAADQTSEARVPKVVRLRDPKLQMVAGRLVIILPIEVEAFETCVLVFELTALVIPEV